MERSPGELFMKKEAQSPAAFFCQILASLNDHGKDKI
jgi:hypothetical protein